MKWRRPRVSCRSWYRLAPVETRQSMYRCSMRWAMTSRRPPADSAPAVPRKIVASLDSIFSQMRRAVARLRPWNEMRSMRASSFVGGQTAGDGKRLDGLTQETRFAACHGAVIIGLGETGISARRDHGLAKSKGKHEGREGHEAHEGALPGGRLRRPGGEKETRDRQDRSQILSMVLSVAGLLLHRARRSRARQVSGRLHFTRPR